ncbi:nucleoprotein [Killamcar virus 1]|nr:nucleoprotein [Killamcar virus 1]
MTNTVEKAWISFTVNIGAVGDEITPLSLLEVTTTPLSDVPAAKQLVTEEDDLWIVFLITGIHRINQLPAYDSYIEKIIERMMDLVKSVKAEAPKPNHKVYTGWSMDPNFLRLIAAIDMFFARFARDGRAKIRFGTIISRYRDCSMISSLVHLKKITGLSPEELQGWIFVPSAGDDYEKIMQPGQEIDMDDSYMPYLSDMKLSMKSPYSAAECSVLHLFAHMTGCYLGSKRSLSARIPEEKDMINVQINAALLAYAVRNHATLEKVFLTEDDEHLEFEEGDAEDLEDGMPDGSYSTAWFSWIKIRRGRLNNQIKEYCNSLIVNDDLRDDSVGLWLYNHPL